MPIIEQKLIFYSDTSKRVEFSVGFSKINIWQYFSNRKLVSQNKLCNMSKRTASSQQSLKKLNSQVELAEFE